MTEKRLNRLSRFSAVLLTLIFAATVVASLWSLVGYRGLYRWMIEWQLAHWQIYYPEYTGIYTVILYFGAAAILSAILVRLGVVRGESDLQAIHWNAAQWTAWLRARHDWLYAHLYRTIFLVLGFSFACWGLIDVYTGITAGELSTADVAALEKGQAPRTRYLQFTEGRLMNGSAMVFGEDRPGAEQIEYLPLVSSQWTQNQGVAVFLQQKHYAAERVGTPEKELKGTILISGLPPMARAQFEKGGLHVATPHYVIAWGESPGNVQFEGWLMAVMGGILFFIAALIWAIQALRTRRA